VTVEEHHPKVVLNQISRLRAFSGFADKVAEEKAVRVAQAAEQASIELS
jgi:hypothetical protein